MKQNITLELTKDGTAILRRVDTGETLAVPNTHKDISEAMAKLEPEKKLTSWR